MEDRQFDPNNTEERPAENATEKQQQGNFLSQFLARRRGEKLDTNETDDDDEETEEKPKHWRAKFKSFFKTVVPPPEGEVAAPKDPPAAELFAWPFPRLFVPKAYHKVTPPQKYLQSRLQAHLPRRHQLKPGK